MKTLATVAFPGGVKVDAKIGEFTIKTDQPEANGGDNSAPAPFDVFLSSLATCAGFFALRFCQSRDIPVQGLELIMEGEKDMEKKIYKQIVLRLKLPTGFPEKYKSAIIKAMDTCTVKRQMADPPEFLAVTE